MSLRAATSSARPNDLKDASRHGLTVAARLGYLTHGIVYGLVGILALLAATGQSGGSVTDSQGAVQKIGGFGEPLLWIVAVGLACYSLWNLVRAVLDPEHCGRERKAILKRLGYGVSAVMHAFVAIYTFQLAAGAGAAGGGGGDRTVAQLFNYPGGRLAIGIAGLAVICFGLFEFYRGVKNDVGKEFSGSHLSAGKRKLALRVARLGLLARGVVFPLIGTSLVIAALNANPSEANGFGDALRQIASQPFGTVMLGVVAVGLIAYGIHMLFVARYAVIPHPG
jgi:type IV secretory pathway VirB2 component (pilin)